MQRRNIIILVAIGVALFVLFVAFLSIGVSALDEPGAFETWLRNRITRNAVVNGARDIEPPAVEDKQLSIARGRARFDVACRFCHGFEGQRLIEVGRYMYPRSPDLASPASQAWSDTEIFWIIKYGIRRTAHPGFGRVHQDEEIWDLVRYVRSLDKSN